MFDGVSTSCLHACLPQSNGPARAGAPGRHWGAGGSWGAQPPHGFPAIRPRPAVGEHWALGSAALLVPRLWPVSVRSVNDAAGEGWWLGVGGEAVSPR